MIDAAVAALRHKPDCMQFDHHLFYLMNSKELRLVMYGSFTEESIN